MAYIGNTPFTKASYSNKEFIATDGQTTFNVVYSVHFVDVLLNGVQLSEEDYTASDGMSIVLNEPCVAGDLVTVKAWGTFVPADSYKSSEVDSLLSSNSTADRDRANHTGTQTLATISDAGTAASEDVTVSATDTTAGRLLKVGDFGVGSHVSLPLGSAFDLNTISHRTAFYGGYNAVNAPSSGIFALSVISYSSTWVTQEFTRLNDSSKWTRAYNGTLAAWTPWQEIYHTGNVLGTVSATGTWPDLTPTGAIIETGSNANGTYTKFADGTMICYILDETFSTTDTTTTAIQGIFNYSSLYAWSFPSTFVSNPTVVCSYTQNTAVIAPSATSKGTTTTSTDLVGCSIYSWGSYARKTVEATAIGRWK